MFHSQNPSVGERVLFLFQRDAGEQIYQDYDFQILENTFLP